MTSKLNINWLNKCRCGNRMHTVETVRGSHVRLFEDDAVKCNSCGREGVIQTCDGIATVLWETDEERAEGVTMTKSTITRERIEQYANDPRMCNINDEIRQMARMALAALDSEPVRSPVLAYADSYRDMAKQGVESVPIWSVITDLERNIAPLYRHAQPAPVVPEEMTPQQASRSYGGEVRGYRAGWNACRAAMLHAGNSPAQSDCCPAQNHVSPAQDGNSPVVPDGYVMVSASLLSDLRDWAHPEIEEYCEMWAGRRDDEFPALRKVIADADALLAAAPQSPGSEPATVPGKWIPVSERMPESNGMYFGWDGKRVLEVYCFFGGFSANQFIHGEITHWMPLPAAPQEPKP